MHTERFPVSIIKQLRFHICTSVWRHNISDAVRETKRSSIGRCDLSYYLYGLFRRNFVVTKTRIIREWPHATIIITTVIGRIRMCVRYGLAENSLRFRLGHIITKKRAGEWNVRLSTGDATQDGPISIRLMFWMKEKIKKNADSTTYYKLCKANCFFPNQTISSVFKILKYLFR